MIIINQFEFKDYQIHFLYIFNLISILLILKNISFSYRLTKIYKLKPQSTELILLIQLHEDLIELGHCLTKSLILLSQDIHILYNRMEVFNFLDKGV